MSTLNKFKIAEAIKKPLVGEIAWSSEHNSTVMFDGQDWLILQMPLFMFTFADLNKETQQSLLDWASTTVPQADPMKLLNTKVFEYTYNDLLSAMEVHSLINFFNE